jgi:hypothetical protein
MKTILLSLILIFSITLQAQTWSPSGATWHYSFMNAFYTIGYIKISYTGDTIIGNQSVKIMEKFGHTYNYWNNQFYSGVFDYEYTFEDAGIVYVWFDNNWDTLYNFNASIGDKWSYAKQPNFPSCDGNSYLTVLDTGTTIINNKSLKFLVLQFHHDSILFFQPVDTLIEIIGFKNSYMFPYDYCDAAFDVNEGGGLRCYSDDNFPLYNPYYPYNCDFIVGFDEETTKDLFVIYPNPVTSVLNIKGLSDPGNYSYNIYSMKGRLVQSGKLNERTEVTELSSGIYFLKLFDNFNSAYLKFIKH